jgi:hypothetical protein
MKKSEKLSLTQQATQALIDAVTKVYEDHRRRGKPLAVWRDGKAVLIHATEIGRTRKSRTPYRTKSGGKSGAADCLGSTRSETMSKSG